jgi:hypothetical protein
MERLTTNKKVSEMGMVELAHNCCYEDDEHNARYRDFEMEMDARDFAINLMITLTKDELPVDKTEFDEEILDNLTIDPFSDVRGLIALFYRNLWAMADLREKLKYYEDAEEHGLLLRLPCKVGDAVYLIDKDENNRLQVYEGKWRRVSLVQTSKNSSFELCGEISYDIHDCFYNDGRTMEQVMYVGQESTRIGKVVFLTREEAEAKLKEMEEKDGE